jgi:hypothetical protein
MKTKIMKNTFTVGQIVRFKNYKRKPEDKEAYFIVIQEEDQNNQLVLFTINTNRFYNAGETIIPEFPHEDLRFVDIKYSDLLNEKIITQDTTSFEVGSGTATAFIGDDAYIEFEQKDGYLLSKKEFEFFSHSQYPIRGHLFILIDYKNMDDEKYNIIP